jgi:hypothetical protein
MTVMIGVDPHKGSHTAVAVDEGERSLAELRLRSGPKQLERLLKRAAVFPERTWAIENATGLGYLLAQQLVAAGERVLDVQPKLAARVRLLATESTNKNDPHDALSVAIAALRSPVPKVVGVEDHAAVMKLWARRHRNLSSTRTQIACRLHAVLCDLVAGGVPEEIYADKAASLLADVKPDGAVAAARVELAEELLDDLRRVDRQLSGSATAPDAATTTARSPRARHRKKRYAPSSAASATPSGPPWSPTPDAPPPRPWPRRRAREGNGERLCRQRGRLTPRNTGSSAKPLPNPQEGYDHQAQPGTQDRRNRPKNCLTNKEDSFGSLLKAHR